MYCRFHYRCKPPLFNGLDGLEVCPLCSAKENKKYRLCTECGKSGLKFPRFEVYYYFTIIIYIFDRQV